MFRHGRFLFQSGRIVTVNDVRAAYRILGLPTTATPESIRHKYLSLARLNHPDVQGGDDSKMKAVNAAYETVQVHRHLLKSEGEDTNVFKRARHQSPLANHAAWNVRSEYDWVAALNVTDEEKASAANHPHSQNRHFTFNDDSIIYRMLREGSSTGQIAQSFGRTEGSILRRIIHPQFKQRIKLMLTKSTPERMKAKPQFRRAINPRRHNVGFRDVDDRRPGAVDIDDEGDAFDELRQEFESDGDTQMQYSAKHMASGLGRSYAHFNRFHRPTKN